MRSLLFTGRVEDVAGRVDEPGRWDSFGRETPAKTSHYAQHYQKSFKLKFSTGVASVPLNYKRRHATRQKINRRGGGEVREQ